MSLKIQDRVKSLQSYPNPTSRLTKKEIQREIGGDYYSSSNSSIIESVQLLNYRKLGHYANICGLNRSEITETMMRIYRLQEAIYELDAYGETTWFVDRDQIDKIWEKIEYELNTFDVKRSSVEDAIGDLKCYQEIEILLREEQFPLEIPLLDFYKIKTCDIQLERAIIKETSRSSISDILNGAWLLFDIASEVQDDIEDYWEDFFSHNFNRIQMEIYFNGISATFEKYIDLFYKLIYLLDSLEATTSDKTETQVILLVKKRVISVFDNTVHFFNSITKR